jgi:hypothetical protein
MKFPDVAPLRRMALPVTADIEGGYGLGHGRIVEIDCANPSSHDSPPE